MSVKVQFKSFGDKKLNVVKAVKVVTGLGLKEAKALVDQVPTVYECVSKERADALVAALREAGATAHTIGFGSDSLDEPVNLLPEVIAVITDAHEDCVKAKATIGIQFSLEGSTDVHTLFLKEPQAVLVKTAVDVVMDNNRITVVPYNSLLLNEVNRVVQKLD